MNKASLVKVPNDTPLDLFASLGCGLQTGTGAIFNTLNVQAENTVAVFGVGSLGLSAIMACKIRQAKEIIAIDIHPSRLELAKELGATAVINSSEGDVMEKIKTICVTTGLNKALDCSGVPEIIETMVDSLGTRGRACSVGSNRPGTRVSIDVHKLFVMGKEYVGCHQGESDPHEVRYCSFASSVTESDLSHRWLHSSLISIDVGDFLWKRSRLATESTIMSAPSKISSQERL